MIVRQQFHHTKVEAVEPFKLHPTSFLHMYKVFLITMLWMGICMHTHTITNTITLLFPPDLRELVETLVLGPR